MRNKITLALITMLLLAGAGILYSRTVVTHRNVSKLVARALSRNADTNYVAHITTTAEYNGRSIRTYATVYRQGTMEKLVYPGSAGRRVWSMLKDGKSYTYLPKENKVLVSETSRVLSDAQRSKLLAKNYKVTSDGSERIAGRDAYVVDITSRYDGRPSKKLWIDKRHMTVLKSIDYSSAGDERGSMEMQQISYNTHIRPSQFDIQNGSAEMVMVCKSAKSMDLFKTLGLSVRVPKYLPAGYKVEGYHLFNSQCSCKHQSAQMTYTDGLNVISVFQTPKMVGCEASGCNMTGGGSRDGCSVANCDVAKTGQMTRGDRTVVVVGDLLPRDVKKIAESVN